MVCTLVVSDTILLVHCQTGLAVGEYLNFVGVALTELKGTYRNKAEHTVTFRLIMDGGIFRPIESIE